VSEPLVDNLEKIRVEIEKIIAELIKLEVKISQMYARGEIIDRTGQS